MKRKNPSIKGRTGGCTEPKASCQETNSHRTLVNTEMPHGSRVFFFQSQKSLQTESALFFFLAFTALVLSCSTWDLVPQPGIKPGPPALGAKGLNHWTTREVPDSTSFKKYLLSAYYMLKTLRISELTKKNLCSLGTCILVRGKGDGRGTGYKTALTYKW